MFLLKLAITWGQPLEYVESLPNDILLQFKALNLIAPFTNDVASKERAVIASILHNQNITKRSQAKQPTDLFPYINGNTDFLEPELYIKAKEIFNSMNPSAPNYQSNVSDFKVNLEDTIRIEQESGSDEYLVMKLKELLRSIS